MKTKRIHTRLMAAILSLMLAFLFCAAMPFTVSAAPEESATETSSTNPSETPVENEKPAENPPAETIITAPDGATPPYQATGNIVENVRQNNPDATGLQFVVFKTASDKVFYLVIDFDKSSDNVYLLTEVGENDLLNFIEVQVDANGNPIAPPANSNNGQQTPGTQPETPEQNNNIGLIVMIIAVLGIGGAAFYFFKSKKGKSKPFANTADFDFDDEDDYDEQTVNDDGADDEQEGDE